MFSCLWVGTDAAATTVDRPADAAGAKAGLFVYHPVALARFSRPLVGAWRVLNCYCYGLKSPSAY